MYVSVHWPFHAYQPVVYNNLIDILEALVIVAFCGSAHCSCVKVSYHGIFIY